MLAVFRSRSRSQYFGRDESNARHGNRGPRALAPLLRSTGCWVGTRLAGWTAQWAPQCGVDAPLNGGNERGRLARWAWGMGMIFGQMAWPQHRLSSVVPI